MAEAIPQGPSATKSVRTEAPWSVRLFPNHEWVLLLVLLLEGIVFSLSGKNFLSSANAFEVARLSVEIGLLALALTPVIVTGGIDLSVGSLLGLSAVLLGKMWRDGLSVTLFGHGLIATGPVPVWTAALCVLVLATLGGGLNALLITRLRIPALIVTLGSFSLFRGLAEGLTGGVQNFTGFPEQFLFLGQGHIFGTVPAQLPIFVAAAARFWLLLHRSAVGRARSAIGFSPDGARHAGIRVERWVALTYLLSGLSAG